ncbi:hypothetical protein IKF74_01600 [Candidatus Saccharibacteria bacterium]|nr:hypothetical protein [Candidatus Saccharibacteria bacterium]
MSPSNNEPEDKSQKPITEPDTELKDEGDPTEAEIIAAFTEETSEKSPEDKPKETKPKKKLAKKTKIIIGVSAWLVLVGAAVALAFILKPAEETEHLAPVVAEFKWVDDQADKDLDYVDIDYYGYYDANSIYLERMVADDDYSSPYYYVYRVRGLKNRTVEDKINQRILSVVDALVPLAGKESYQKPRLNVGASLNNVLSFSISYYSAEDTSITKTFGITFDLNTGNELSFDDIFIKNYDPTQYLHKAFYDGLSSNLQFRRKYLDQNISYAEWNLEHPEYYTDKHTAEDDRKAIEKYRAEIAEIDAAFNDMESYSLEKAKKYLAGDKQFYLNAYGPAFIYEDGTAIVKSEAGDNAKYLAFYRDYKTNDSLFENNSLGAKHIFYTYNDISLTDYGETKRTIVESNNYLLETLTYSNDFPDKNAKYQDYIKNQLLALANQSGKFYSFALLTNVYRAGSSGLKYNYYIASVNVVAESCDENYYKTTYRKAIIDGKTQNAFYGTPFQPARTGRFDPNEIAKIDTNNDIRGVNAVIDESNKIYAEPSEIFVEGSGWEDYLKEHFYSTICRYQNGYCQHIDYSDVEKSHHNFGYRFNGGDINYGIKSNSSNEYWAQFEQSTNLPIYRIPNEYLKEPFKH